MSVDRPKKNINVMKIELLYGLDQFIQTITQSLQEAEDNSPNENDELIMATVKLAEGLIRHRNNLINLWMKI